MYKQTTHRKGYNNKPNPRFQKLIENLPETTLNLVKIVKNNADIREFTAKGIIKLLKEREVIPVEAKCGVTFFMNKFAVSVDGLKTEYNYTESFFMSAFINSFALFANRAQNAINAFTEATTDGGDNTNTVAQPVEEEDSETTATE